MAGAERSGVEDLLPHLFEDRAARLEQAAVAARHDGELAGNRPFHATGNRRIHESDAACFEQRRKLPRADRRGRAHVEDDRPLAEPGRHAVAHGVLFPAEHFSDDPAVGKHRDDQLRVLAEFREGGGRRRLPRRGESADALGVQVENGELVAGGRQVSGHRRSHGTDPNEPDFANGGIHSNHPEELTAEEHRTVGPFRFARALTPDRQVGTDAALARKLQHPRADPKVLNAHPVRFVQRNLAG